MRNAGWTPRPSGDAACLALPPSAYNGVAFKPTLVTSAYSVGAGNANSALAQRVDNTGTSSSLSTGGGGTVTFTVLELARVAGSFTFTATSSATPSAAGVAVAGTFDIKLP